MNSRRGFACVFVACCALLGFGLVLQHVKNLEPCAMCILQRYAFVAIAVVALIAAIHGRGAKVYGALMLLAALAGGGVAGWQAWLQRFPTKALECGPELEYTLQSFPLADALPMIFKGGGDCSKIQWTFLGGTIPEWSLVWFVIFAAGAVLILRSKGSQAS